MEANLAGGASCAAGASIAEVSSTPVTFEPPGGHFQHPPALARTRIAWRRDRRVRWPAMATARNQVRPQDLGRRVSFQYELPNGYVGEVVGVLEAWDEAANTYLVRDRNGGLVRVPALGVRFGKVVPGP